MSIHLYANFLLGNSTGSYQVLPSSGPNLLHIYDVPRQADIDVLLQRFPDTEYIVSDHVVADQGSYNCHGRRLIGLPIAVVNDVNLNIKPGVQPIDELTTTACANFISNKKQISRFLCIKLVEWFNLTVNYTWSGAGDTCNMAEIINELDEQVKIIPFDQDLRTFLLSPITIQPRFVTNNNELIKLAPNASQIPVTAARGEKNQWRAGLDEVFLTSAVSLITESVRFERMAMFTEKTVYSALGCTFPIWVGGYNQAQEWKNLGFDIFEDVIDHSYQSYPTLIERCYYAFKNNLDILTDLNLASELRKTHQARLLANRELVLDNQIERALFDKISGLPSELQDPMTVLANRLVNKSNSKKN